MGDIDGDGDLDVLVASGGRFWLNNGSGTFTAGPTLSNTGERVVGFADVDSDGDLDVVTAFGLGRLLINQGGTQGGTEGAFVYAAGAFGAYARALSTSAQRTWTATATSMLCSRISTVQNRVHLNQGGLQAGTEGQFAFANSFGMSM